MDNIDTLQKMIDENKNIVFFGGAGVSTESGIPDFRSADGLYMQKTKYPPERIISRSFFLSHTEEFFEYYRKKLLHLNAKPSVTHIKLFELEREGKLKAVITQNIDGLHQKAGSKNVLELHGSIYRNYCSECGKTYDAEFVYNSKGVPKCNCGGTVRPDVVLYEETLDNNTIQASLEYISEADVLLVGGTSLVVHPAAGLVDYYHGDKLVLINKSPTPYDRRAALVINENIGETLKQIAV